MDGKTKKVGWSLGIGSIFALLYGIDPIKFTEYLSLAMQQEISRLMIAFSVAAWIHSGRVKKEFKGVTEAINSLGSALRLDLSALSSRVGDLEKTVGLDEKRK